MLTHLSFANPDNAVTRSLPLLMKNTQLLCISLISAVSAVTLASSAAAMPRTGTPSYAALMQARTEATELKAEFKTSTSAELKWPSVGELDTKPQVAVNPPENTATTTAFPGISSPNFTSSRVLDPIDGYNLDSELMGSVGELDTEPQIPVTPPENTAATPMLPAINSPNSADSSVLELTDADHIDSNSMDQVTSVSQLSDLQPTDWAFQALQSLVERYGCIVGYSNGTYQGNRAMTRYEFAAALNACLDKVSELMSSATSNLARQEDLAKLQRLQQEFAAELTTLRGRVDSLEDRTAQLEANQFSTTTKLNGNVIFTVQDAFSGRGDNQAVLQQLTYLQLSTSFTGRDLLVTSLAASNAEIPELEPTNNGKFVGATREGLNTWAYGGSTGNDIFLLTLEYLFPLIDKKNNKLYVTLAATNGFNTSRFLLPISSLSWEGYELGSGPVSAFAQRNPLYRLGGGQGIIANYDTGPWRLTLGYLASEGSDPSEGAGLLDGDYLALAQLNFTPSDRFAVALAYRNNYFGAGRFAFNNQYNFGSDSPGFIGTALANRFDNAGVFFQENVPVVSNSYGVQAYYRVSPKLIIGGFATKINARLIGHGDADIWTYAVDFAFPDLGKKGNLGGLIVGVEPTLTGLRVGDNFVGGFKRDTSLHIEGFYKYQVTDNISITPGFIWITAPNQDADNEDIVTGLIRTTFSF